MARFHGSRLAVLSLVASACGAFGTDDGPSVGSDGGSVLDAKADAVTPDADADAGLAAETDAAARAPNPSCTIQDVPTKTGTTFTLSPPKPPPNTTFQPIVHDSMPLANVELAFCTPDTVAAIRVMNATPFDSNPYGWRFPPASLPAGVTQIAFRADPNRRVYATTRIIIE